MATGGVGVVGESSERKGHKEPWLVKTNKNKKIKKGLEISISTAPPPLHSWSQTAGKLLFPFAWTEQKCITVDALPPQRLSCNFPTTGWSLPKAKIIPALKYINGGGRRIFDQKCDRGVEGSVK